ncbi:thymidylate synthase [Pseudomonas viridiflava]|uniref:thymidylate synthase n=1 Tax=Pseudomonas viridiflava TaxID=33069 RepID=UPI001C2CE21A|nr:thymidylate synthase [Pseudomonas viridiflava]MBV1808190.1 thymidylate synthase [Pseudomonas viridiflava]
MLAQTIFESLDDAYRVILKALLDEGGTANPRSIPTAELIATSFTLLDPRRRYISNPERRWSLAYALAEYSWHARGSNSLEEIAWYAPAWRHFTSGDTVVGSAYGSSIFKARGDFLSQWDTVINLLKHDPSSRRAVLYLGGYDPSVSDSQRDIACSLSLQLILRAGKLEAICYMRSNDAMIGLPYDVFLFTMIQEMAALTLGCGLGPYHHFVGSLHLYETHREWASRILSSDLTEKAPMPIMSDLDGLRAFQNAESLSRNSLCLSNEDFDGVSSYWRDMMNLIIAWNGEKVTGRSDDFALGADLNSMLFNLYGLRKRAS